MNACLSTYVALLHYKSKYQLKQEFFDEWELIRRNVHLKTQSGLRGTGSLCGCVGVVGHKEQTVRHYADESRIVGCCCVAPHLKFDLFFGVCSCRNWFGFDG